MSSLSPRLEISLSRIQDNYTDLVAAAPKTEVAAVLKANAYGLGMDQIAPALVEAGCKTFWVARTQEAITLRALAPESMIYVLGGPDPELMSSYQSLRLRPVLSTGAQVQRWQSFAFARDVEPAAVHVETGFNRLALRGEEIGQTAQKWREGRLKISLILSHLACSDDPAHPMNAAQLAQFEDIKALFPNIPASLAASFGFFLPNPAFKQDMVRVGRALYGIRATVDDRFLTQPTLLLSAPVLQIATVTDGATVGYGATWRTQGPRKIATLSLGYADGIPRSLQDKGCVYFVQNDKTYVAPLAGRISMDLLCCDVTDIPAGCVAEGSLGYLVTKQQDIMRIGRAAGTIGYEILSHLGTRFDRFYHTA